MLVIQNDKTYKKTDKSTQKSISKGINRLIARLTDYASQNIAIENVLNDDILIHDIINKCFYVYKCQVDKIQLRILYTVSDGKLIIVSHYCKKKPTKEYIAYFEKVSAVYQKQIEKFNDR